MVPLEAVDMHPHQCVRPEKRERRRLARMLPHIRHSLPGVGQGPGGADALRPGHRLPQFEHKVRQQVCSLWVLPRELESTSFCLRAAAMRVSEGHKVTSLQILTSLKSLSENI